ncbi:uncharacterized protein LOC117900130 [Drosophila subobscura]|uniref:uncharacterized protein LOC117900130 n=1 Tax=Drosophila subobscura TaxID=7241 RepID=UPI00155A06BB|nr:uncharacterized protein LOC117900130 [Drosophila subobscura]
MFKFLFIFLLSISTYKLIRANRDPHLCSFPVDVTYIEEVFTPLNEYGPFADYFKKMDINGSRKNVTKTKTEMRELCCPGYIISRDGDGLCQPMLTTTPTKAARTTSTTDLDITDATDSTSWSTSWDDDSSTELHSSTTTEEALIDKPAGFSCMEYAVYVACAILIFLLALSLACYKRKQKMYRVKHENQQVKYDAEVHRSLI